MSPRARQRARATPHPYLAGNFAPIRNTLPLTPCAFVGQLPDELAGGQYVRNGGNPLKNEDLGRDAHWFDGDGMLSGVLFRRTEKHIQPEFVNQYILTDVFLASKAAPSQCLPFTPSIATLVSPLSTLFQIIAAIFRTIALVILSRLPGSPFLVRRISVANTGILYHDGRALATCESGPPLRIQLPELSTVGWFNGRQAENEPQQDDRPGYGGQGPLSFMREWTTGHPRVDPQTNELVTFHSSFAPPYLHYSVVPAASKAVDPMLNLPVPGLKSAKLMHDFGVSSNYTTMFDLPLSIDLTNLARGLPPVAYNPAQPSRFGVFPRYQPDRVQWYETAPCCIFHTANAWETRAKSPFRPAEETTLHMLVCRLTSASVVYGAGDLEAPAPTQPIPSYFPAEEEQCRLYYYEFPVDGPAPIIRNQWALSAIPFEFPSLNPAVEMQDAQFIYGCSNLTSTFNAALGRAIKIDALAKVDVKRLIARGKQHPPETVRGCVDTRSVVDILQTPIDNDPIQIFHLPVGHFAQEPRFVSRANPASEDDGWLLTYVFNETTGLEMGECRADARSELWVIDARNMRDVVARVQLPQRVPYGLHGNWFEESKLLQQRTVSGFRAVEEIEGRWDGLRQRAHAVLG